MCVLPLVALAAAGAQTSITVQPTSLSPATTGGAVNPYPVRGKVLNLLTGVGIPRALVTLANRRVLTDAQGQFEFPGYTQARGAMAASKPGFSSSADGGPASRTGTFPDLSIPVQLALYPDALLTGAVSGRDGLPIAGAQIHLYLANADINGFTWVPSGFTQTDSHGEYRFSTPPGRYRVGSGYLPRSRDSGEAVLPTSFPEYSSSERLRYLTLAPGEEKRIDLRPRIGFSFPLLVHLLPADTRGARFSVTDNAGETFFVASEPQSAPGTLRITLPPGAYTVRAHVDDRTAALEGITRVSVNPQSTAAATLQLTPLPSLAVDVTVDPAALPGSTSVISSLPITVNIRQFNLHLHNLNNLGQGADPDVPLIGSSDGLFQFRVPPGHYRLQGSQSGTWHVESATYGQTNLLANELVIAQGSGGATIRIVADNRSGMLQGTVRLPASVASAWVYLIPRAASLSVSNPVVVVSPGSFTTRVAVGSYDVVAVDHPLHLDLHDPEVMGHFSGGAKALEMTADATIPLQLDLAQEKGANQ